MYLTSLTTLLTLASLAVASIVTPTDPTTLEARDATKTLRYCTSENQKSCRAMAVAKGECYTSSVGLPLLFFDDGLKCTVYGHGGCPSAPKNKVKGVKVAFNAHTNPAAENAGIWDIWSFKCSN